MSVIKIYLDKNNIENIFLAKNITHRTRDKEKYSSTLCDPSVI